MTRLAALLASLVQESSKGVVSGQSGTVEKELELLASLDESPESLVEDQAVDSFLRERFPALEAGLDDGTETAATSDSDEGDHLDTAVRPGAIYVDPDEYEHSVEYPPIQSVLGIDVTDDLQTDNGRTILTEAAVGRIREEVRRRLGTHRREVLERTVQYGLPSPRVTDLELGVNVAFEGDLDASLVTTDADVDPSAIGHLTLHVEFEEHIRR